MDGQDCSGEVVAADRGLTLSLRPKCKEIRYAMSTVEPTMILQCDTMHDNDCKMYIG